MKRETIIKKSLSRTVKLLFPQRCPVCDEPVPIKDGLICRGCRGKLVYVKEPYCMKCGKSLMEEEKEYCSDCRKMRHLYSRGRALFEYESVAGAIYRFKYSGRREYAAFFGEEAVRELGNFIRKLSPDALIPVPLAGKRKMKRGYNQAEVLAKEIGRLMDIPVYSHFIRRVKNTVPQKQLNPTERQNNLKKAFKITENDVKLSTIIIVDDIYTTGSTVDAMSAVLQQAGIQKIYYVALAVGAGP